MAAAAAEGLSLQCLQRDEGSSFVRLSPVTARALWQRAVDDDNHSKPRGAGASSDGVWKINAETGSSRQVSSGVEFLPLQIDWTDDDDCSATTTTIYASYNGGDIQPGRFLLAIAAAILSVCCRSLLTRDETCTQSVSQTG
jgi:hypothetical protein